MMDEEEVEEEETENHLPPLLTHDEERKEGNSSTFGPLWGRQVFARAVHAWVEGEEEGGREKKSVQEPIRPLPLSVQFTPARPALPSGPVHIGQLSQQAPVLTSRN